jgi:DNA-binding GntR family transcriptional regulator
VSTSPRRVDAEAIYAELRAEILAGRLPAGQPLRETAVAARFGVSRTPTREAFRRLEHDRLLIPGVRGLRVRAIDTDEVVQVCDMRILLEGEAAAQAAGARTTGDLLQLEGLLARDRSLDEPADETRAATNMDFHRAIWRAAHNSVLEDLLQRLTVHLVRSPRSTLSAPGRWAESLDEHAALIDAVRGHDAERARALFAAHLGTARKLRLDLLREHASGSTRR